MSDPQTNDGGAAFPTTPVSHGYPHDASGHGTGASPGMTLRDWYAGLAMQGFLAAGDPWDSWEQLASHCQGVARAMLDSNKLSELRLSGKRCWQTPGSQHVGRFCWIEQLDLGSPPRLVGAGDDGRFRYWDERSDIWRLFDGGVIPIGIRPV